MLRERDNEVREVSKVYFEAKETLATSQNPRDERFSAA
jgi:hypothetical protein